MPLELNGKQFTISDAAVLRKYSKEMIFTVSKQFIKRNNDPEMRPIETAPIHIPTAYNFYVMQDGLRISQGILRYYQSHSSYNENGRTVDNWTPQYIAIGHSGVLKSSDVDLNFFLDNCPWNEKVKGDSLHPNYSSTAELMCRTFSREERAAKELSQQKMASELMMMLLDDSVYPLERLRSLAKVVSGQSNARKIVHRLFDIDKMEDTAIRAELTRLSQTYTFSMNEIMKMETTDLSEEVERWKNLKIIEFTAEQEWIFWESDKVRKPIMAVPSNTDPTETLVYFLKNHDPYYKWYKPISERFKKVNKKLSKQSSETQIQD